MIRVALPISPLLVVSLLLCASSAAGCGLESTPPTSDPIERVALGEGKLDDLSKGAIRSESLHELLELDERIPLEASGVAWVHERDVWSVAFDNFTALGVLEAETSGGELHVDDPSLSRFQLDGHGLEGPRTIRVGLQLVGTVFEVVELHRVPSDRVPLKRPERVVEGAREADV